MYSWILFIIVVAYLLNKNKEDIKKVSSRDKVVVVGTLLFLLSLAAKGIYYAGNWIAGFIENGALKNTFQIVWILIFLGITGYIWDTVLNKVKRDSGIN